MYANKPIQVSGLCSKIANTFCNDDFGIQPPLREIGGQNRLRLVVNWFTPDPSVLHGVM